ncbi:MAG: extracellular solute-binding protein [Roseburia sp.]|nr:extracellular solute-binding protein [Roseburia sp.]
MGLRNQRSKYAGLLLAAALVLTGCGEGAEETEEKAAKEPVTFQWYINFSWYNTDFGENIVSKKITEDTGVDIRFITPTGNEAELLNSLISANNLPDIITLGWWEDQVDIMIEKGMVYALNELAEEYDPYFFQVTDAEVVDWYTRGDGNIYCYPNSTYTPKDYEEHDDIGSNQTFLVRKDIYEAIGSPDMTTPEGFAAAVRAAAEMFPEVEGEPLIPIGSDVFSETGCNSFDQYLQNFLAIPFEKDGVYYDRYTDEDYVTWLKMFRELGSEGYLKKDIFIDQRTQMEEKLAKGQYFCMIYQRTDMADQEKELYAKDPDKIYIAVDGPRNRAGDDPMLPGAGINGWTVTLISKNCQNPEKAIELFSYLISEEGQKLTYLGVEGETYDTVDGNIVLKKEVKDLLNRDRNEYDRIYGADNAYWMFQDNVMQLQWKYESEEDDPVAQLEQWTMPYTHFLAQYEICFDANTTAGNCEKQIKELWSYTLPKLLLAPSEEEFDRIFNEFVEKREKLGFSIVMEESNRQVKETKELLGLE